MLPHDCSADWGLWLSWLLRFELISFLASLYTKNPASPKTSFLNSSTAAFLLWDRYNMIQHDTTAYTLKMNALGSWKGGPFMYSSIVFAIFIGAQANWNWWGLFSCSSAGQLSEWRDAKSLMESWTCWTIDSSQLHATGTNVRTCKYPGLPDTNKGPCHGESTALAVALQVIYILWYNIHRYHIDALREETPFRKICVWKHCHRHQTSPSNTTTHHLYTYIYIYNYIYIILTLFVYLLKFMSAFPIISTPPTASSKLRSQEKPIKIPNDWIKARLGDQSGKQFLFYNVLQFTCRKLPETCLGLCHPVSPSLTFGLAI